MLPSHVLSRRHRIYFHPHRSTYRNLLDILLTRSRLTNLGLIIFSSITSLSLLLNLLHYLNSTVSPADYSGPGYQLFVENDDSQNVFRESWTESLDHLIVVPGHAIWKGVDPAKRTQDSEWILKPYQKGVGKTQVFWEHIAVGYGHVRVPHSDRADAEFNQGRACARGRKIATGVQRVILFRSVFVGPC
jgi:hypothetical protein